MNTKIQEGCHMYSIPEKAHAEQSSIKSVSNFYDKYRLGRALKAAGAYKGKGVPVSAVIKYLISLIYTGKSMFQDMRSESALACGFGRDTVYRLLNKTSVNWQLFMLNVAERVTDDIARLTSESRRNAFVIDDTMYNIPYTKKTELVSKVYDHAEKGKNKYKRGFRMLTLGWTDGASFIPLSFRHLASSDKKNRYCESRVFGDKRSIAYRIRKEAVSKATEVMLILLSAALKSGVNAKYVLFDSWFAFPTTIIKIRTLGLHTASRMKDTTKIRYFINGEKKTAKEIFKGNRKRRGKSRYLLSVIVSLCSSETGEMLPARLVYVRNRQKRNAWIALICTDTELTEEEITALYGKRWDIEVFFKVCKSYLRLTGEFHQLSYDALTAHAAIVMLRYMILSLEKRKSEDPRSLGDLFFTCCDEVSDIRFEQALLWLMTILTETLREEAFCFPEELMLQFMVGFIEKLPLFMRTCLQSGFAG
jgi:hypothetical protein